MSEPISHMNVTRNYEKFIVMSTKCLQLWCIKHYCDFLTFIGFVQLKEREKINIECLFSYRSPILKISCTSHPDYPIRSTLLCKDSTIRIVACATGDVLTSLVCDLNFKPTSCAYAIGESRSLFFGRVSS